MAYIKFSSFKKLTRLFAETNLVGYDGQDNIRIPYKDLFKQLEIDESTAEGAPIEFIGNELPSENNTGGELVRGNWTIAGPGTYTQTDGSDVIVPENSFGFIFYDGDEWSLGSSVAIDIPADIVLHSEFDPVKDKVDEVIVPSENLADTAKFIAGRLNEDGTMHMTPSSLSMDYISVPSDSDITISGFAGAGIQYVRYALLDSENNLITYEMANGKADKESITIHTPSELGVKLAVTVAVGDSAGQEWLDGNSPYPDTFLINLGDEPIDFVHGGLTINSPAFISKILNLLPDNGLPLIDEGEIWD